MQIDQAERGFSYMQDGPLDMRMDPDKGTSASDLLAAIEVDELAGLLAEFGDVRRPRRIARAVLRERDDGRLEGTADLRRAVESVAGTRDSYAELSRVFQALRIVVNGELTALDAALLSLPRCLAAGGSVVVISYHSLEDRRVKQYFQRESQDCLCPPELPVCACGHRRQFELLTRKAICPDRAEQARNPRARSARLRAARRLAT